MCSLTDDQLLQIFSFMANFPSALEASLAHRHSQRQPAEEESSSFDHTAAGPSRAEQDSSTEVRNAPAGPSRVAEPRRGGLVKARAQRGCVKGRRTQKKGGDPVRRGEDVARSLLMFEVDRHP